MFFDISLVLYTARFVNVAPLLSSAFNHLQMLITILEILWISYIQERYFVSISSLPLI